jgi:hypothetical protein
MSPSILSGKLETGAPTLKSLPKLKWSKSLDVFLRIGSTDENMLVQTHQRVFKIVFIDVYIFRRGNPALAARKGAVDCAR